MTTPPSDLNSAMLEHLRPLYGPRPAADSEALVSFSRFAGLLVGLGLSRFDLPAPIAIEWRVLGSKLKAEIRLAPQPTHEAVQLMIREYAAQFGVPEVHLNHVAANSGYWTAFDAPLYGLEVWIDCAYAQPDGDADEKPLGEIDT